MENIGAQPGAFADLAMRIRTGDRAAEEQVVLWFRPRVEAFARARTHRRELADELTQEVLMAVICALREGRVEHPDNLPAYIYGTARNLWNDSLRSSARQKTEPFPEHFDPPAKTDQNDEYFRMFAARQIISGLEQTDQRILLLTLVDGLTAGEIAARMELTSETVRQRKSRALKRLISKISTGSLRRKEGI